MSEKLTLILRMKGIGARCVYVDVFQHPSGLNDQTFLCFFR